ncbi:hypothetical protein ILYODFUR_036115 [Ilyodon furcidens]|uniref:Ubiquitin-like domain-containing protein n=1 Tax=Ilyodon furcidens TaxID=33524 RepID=A0ABV0U189_9TELE
MENQTDRMLIGRPGDAQKIHWKVEALKDRSGGDLTSLKLTREHGLTLGNQRSVTDYSIPHFHCLICTSLAAYLFCLLFFFHHLLKHMLKI